MTEFCPVQYSLYVQVLRSSVLAALLHGTLAVDVSQTLQRGTRNRIMELLQRAPPIFGRAAITFGIGLHSSLCLLYVVLFNIVSCLQCFDTVGWAAERASGL